MEKILLIVGVSICGILGTIHLFYTFYTDKFSPFDPSVKVAMKVTSPNITKDTSMWLAWIGFNASHSLGAMFFAVVYIPLAAYHFEIIENSLWFSLVPVAFGSSYLVLAKKYWFQIPFTGILISLMCFVGSAWLINS